MPPLDTLTAYRPVTEADYTIETRRALGRVWHCVRFRGRLLDGVPSRRAALNAIAAEVEFSRSGRGRMPCGWLAHMAPCARF